MTQSNRVTHIRQTIEANLRDYWQECYTAYIEDRETDRDLWDDRRLDPKQLTANPRAAYQFYRETVEQQDWGSVLAYQTEVEAEAIDIIYVVTDGDDGWLEVYDRKGNLIGAARRYIELLSWEEVDRVRERVKTLDFPPDLDTQATLWQ